MGGKGNKFVSGGVDGSKNDNPSPFVKDDKKAKPVVEVEDIINEIIITKENITLRRKNGRGSVILGKPDKKNNYRNDFVVWYKTGIRFCNISKNVVITFDDSIKNNSYMVALVGGDLDDGFIMCASRQDGSFKEFFFEDNRYCSIEVLSSYGISSTESMFASSGLRYLDISKLDTSKVVNMASMFHGCEKLHSIVGLDKLNTGKVTDMGFMFNECSKLESLPDMSKWNTNNVKNMSCMFEECSALSSLPDISKWDTSNVTDMGFMFSGCSSLSSLPDISKWNTDNVTDMSYMFSGCSSLSVLPYISKWNTINVKNMSGMFNGCDELKPLPDISKWNTSKVTNMNCIFSGCKSLISLPDISKWDISKVANMSYMFSGCESLLSLPDISKWNTNNVTNMSGMFSGCKKLKSLPDIPKWRTSNVTNMSGMFEGCEALELLPDLSRWNISNVANMMSMFKKCGSLTQLPDISKWDTSNVTDMSYMFEKCYVLKTLDLSRFKSNYSKVYGMFEDCGVESLDLTGFNFSAVSDLGHLFRGSSVKEIKFGIIPDGVTCNEIFSECNALEKVVFNEDLKCVNLKNALTLRSLCNSGDNKTFVPE